MDVFEVLGLNVVLVKWWAIQNNGYALSICVMFITEQYCDRIAVVCVKLLVWNLQQSRTANTYFAE